MYSSYKLLLVLISNSLSILCFGQVIPLHNFDGTHGEIPESNLIFDGAIIYGTTELGGAFNKGIIYSMDTSGNNFTDLYDFNGINGEGSWNLVMSNGILYGTCESVGVHDSGCMFSFNVNTQVYADIFDFNYKTGFNVWFGFMMVNGKIYGSTVYGGGTNNGGVIFSLNPDGSGYRTIYTFTDTTKGIRPGYLFLRGNKFYGIAERYGKHDLGSIFSIDTDGTNLADIYDYTSYSNTLDFFNGKIFATMGWGGKCNTGQFFSLDTTGSNFRILFDSFCNDSGKYPYLNLRFLGNTIYGVCEDGGIYTDGTIFSIDTGGNNFTITHNFTSLYNQGGIYFNTSANSLYVCAENGGSHNDGAIYKLQNFATNVEDIAAKNETVKVYPNPTSGKAFFVASLSPGESGSVVSKIQIEVYDVLGESVFKETLRETQGEKVINLSEQPNGVYFYRVKNESGDLIGDGKIILSK